MKFAIIAIALAVGFAQAAMLGASTSQASRMPAAEAVCDLSGDQSLLKCYRAEFDRKREANNERYKDLVSRAKDQLQDAAESNAKPRVSALNELIRKVNQTMASSRSNSSQECVRMAAKFRSNSTSAVASVNCRTGHEVSLDKELRRLELQLEVMAIEPQS